MTWPYNKPDAVGSRLWPRPTLPHSWPTTDEAAPWGSASLSSMSPTIEHNGVNNSNSSICIAGIASMITNTSANHKWHTNISHPQINNEFGNKSFLATNPGLSDWNDLPCKWKQPDLSLTAFQAALFKCSFSDNFFVLLHYTSMLQCLT